MTPMGETSSSGHSTLHCSIIRSTPSRSPMDQAYLPGKLLPRKILARMWSCSSSTSSPLRGSRAATPCRASAGTDPAVRLVRLAHGAPVRGAPADRVPREQGLAARARAALLTRGHEAPGMHAAVADRVPDCRPQLAPQVVELVDRQLAHRAPRAQLRAPQRLVGEQVADPGDHALVEQLRLQRQDAAADAVAEDVAADLGRVRPDVREVRLDQRGRGGAWRVVPPAPPPPPAGNLAREAVPLPRARLPVARYRARHAEMQPEIRAAVAGLDP